MKYEKRVQILRDTQFLGNVEAGFVGIVESIVERAAECDDQDAYIAEEVRQTLRAYKEVVGEI